MRRSKKLRPRPPLMDRLTDLCQVGGVEARIRRLGTGGNDMEDGVYQLDFIDSVSFEGMIYDDHGGGTYEIRFNIDRKPLLLRDGRLETHIFSIAGEPKIKEKSFLEKLDAAAKNLGIPAPDLLLGLVRLARRALATLVEIIGPEAAREAVLELYQIYQEYGWDIDRMVDAINAYDPKS